MAKAEISWTRTDEDGEKRQIYAHHVGAEWRFFHRHRRFEEWETYPQPALEDWLELLDAVRRRINRRLLRPEEESRVLRTIRERYPEAEVS